MEFTSKQDITRDEFMQGLHLETAKETAEFQKIMDNVIPHLIGTKQGPTLIALLAHKEKGVDGFIEQYCEKIESTFSNEGQADSAKEYANSIRALRAYANKYEQVREFLGTVSETLSQAKAELDTVKERPAFLEDLLTKKLGEKDAPSHSK